MRHNKKTMSLSELLSGIVDVPVTKDVCVTGVSEYSADVETGDVFIALSSLDYGHEAINSGAVAIVCQSDCKDEVVAKNITFANRSPLRSN